jgi:hypothetical protein
MLKKAMMIALAGLLLPGSVYAAQSSTYGAAGTCSGVSGSIVCTFPSVPASKTLTIELITFKCAADKILATGVSLSAAVIPENSSNYINYDLLLIQPSAIGAGNVVSGAWFHKPLFTKGGTSPQVNIDVGGGSTCNVSLSGTLQ